MRPNPPADISRVISFGRNSPQYHQFRNAKRIERSNLEKHLFFGSCFVITNYNKIGKQVSFRRKTSFVIRTLHHTTYPRMQERWNVWMQKTVIPSDRSVCLATQNADVSFSTPEAFSSLGYLSDTEECISRTKNVENGAKNTFGYTSTWWRVLWSEWRVTVCSRTYWMYFREPERYAGPFMSDYQADMVAI